MSGKTVEIAGAGLAGLMTALAFADAGWKVRVHERNPSLRPYGAGIFLYENAIKLFEVFGLKDELLAAAPLIDRYITATHEGKKVFEFPHSMKDGTSCNIPERAVIHEILHQAAEKRGAEFLTGSEMVRALPEGVLISESGERFEADLIVCADGIYSKLRESLGMRSVRYRHEFGAHRLVVPREEGDLTEFDGCRAVDYFNPVTERRFLVAACGTGKLYYCIGAHARDFEHQQIPLNKDLWKADFPLLERYIDRIGGEGRWDVFESIVPEKWSDGRVVLAGDAAHGMPPTLGQGASSGMMSGLCLAACMTGAETIETGIETWLARITDILKHTQNYSMGLINREVDVAGGLWNDQSLRTSRYVPYGVEEWPQIREKARASA